MGSRLAGLRLGPPQHLACGLPNVPSPSARPRKQPCPAKGRFVERASVFAAAGPDDQFNGREDRAHVAQRAFLPDAGGMSPRDSKGLGRLRYDCPCAPLL